jgi:hypothetical protein
VEPSLLLHPLDFLGCDDLTELGFFPAMNLGHREKLDSLCRFLDILGERFRVVTMAEHAGLVSGRQKLPERSWSTTERHG